MRRFVEDITKYWRYLFRAAKAELDTEVAGSHLGAFWWFLEPFCFMLVYAFLVVTVFKAHEQYMLAFVFVGITVWQFFSKSLTASVKMIKTNKNVVIKVYLPKFILVIQKLFVNFFKLVVSFILVLGLGIYYHIPLSWHVLEIIPLLVLLWIGTFALSLFIMHSGVFVIDLEKVIDIVLRLVLYASGIFYSVSKRIPAPYGPLLSKINPVAFIIESSRGCLLYGTGTNWLVYGAWLVASVVLCILGIRVIYRYENSYVKVLS